MGIAIFKKLVVAIINGGNDDKMMKKGISQEPGVGVPGVRR